jgi:hypothetical protein
MPRLCRRMSHGRILHPFEAPEDLVKDIVLSLKDAVEGGVVIDAQRRR